MMPLCYDANLEFIYHIYSSKPSLTFFGALFTHCLLGNFVVSPAKHGKHRDHVSIRIDIDVVVGITILVLRSITFEELHKLPSNFSDR